MDSAGDKPLAPAKPEKAPIPFTFRGETTHLWQAPMWNFGRFLSRIASVILFRLRTQGTQNVPSAGPVLMVTNHQSFLDPWLIGIGLQRQIHFMARDSLFKGGFLHWLMECLNCFPVRRGTADLAAIRTAIERLEKGFVVNIFPEGTRSTDGSIGAIAPGIALITNRCKRPVPILPVVIDGAFDAWPRNQKFPHPHKIRIIYGKPIPPEDYKSLKPPALAERIRNELIKLQKEIGSAHV